MEKFNHFVGPWVQGKSVAVYGHGETRKLVAETCGGKPMYHTHKAVIITADEYERLREKWMCGCLDTSDARVSYRALNYLAKAKD